MEMKKILAAVFLTGIMAAGTVQAKAPELIGEYDDWAAYYVKDGKGIICYMASTPKKDEGKYSKRGDIYVTITHRPAEKSFDVVNFTAGYTYKVGAPVVVKIGKDTFTRLFTDKDKAWAVDDKADKELVAAMKRGQRMIVDGFSSKGTATKDTYSLRGFTGAYKAISSKCKKR